MSVRLGIIGVGHFAGFLVEGFRNKYPDLEITLSPRGAEMSKLLAQKFDCTVAKDNQNVVDQSDIIIISVRPDLFEDVTGKINFKEDQITISVASGIMLEDIKKAVAPSKGVRALAISSAAINKSPVYLYPNVPDIKDFLAALGTVHVMENEEQFTAAAAYTALYGWGFKLLDEAANWGAENGLEKEQALTLMREVIGGVADMAERDADIPMDKLVEGLATKGGITELGLSVLNDHDGFEAWHHALDEVHKRLKGKD